MSDIFSILPAAGGGAGVAVVDIPVNLSSGTVNEGELYAVSCAAANSLAGNTAAAATAGLRRNAIAGVVLANGSQKQFTGPTTIYLRVRGQAKALTKNTGGSAAQAVGDRLGFGTAKAMEFQTSTVDTNRYIAILLEAHTSQAAAATTLVRVLMDGVNGLGIAGGAS